MIPLFRHSLRQLRPVLTFGSLGLACILLLQLGKKGGPTDPAFFVGICSPLVFYCPALLYSSKFATDFWLPVRRGTLYHAKMAALCLVVGFSCGVPILVMQTIRTGELTMEIVRGTVTLVSWLIAGVCVSALVWPQVYPRKVSAGLDSAMCLGCAFLSIAYGAVVILVILFGFGGFWLAPCLLTVLILAYGRGCRTFCRHEVAPAHESGAAAWEPTGPRTQSTVTQRSHADYPDAHGQDRTAVIEPQPMMTRVRSAQIPRKPSPRWNDPAPGGILKVLFERIPPSWRLALRVTWLRSWLLLCVLVVTALGLGSVAKSFVQKSTDMTMFWVVYFVFLVHYNAESWALFIIGAMPAACPRKKLFVAWTRPVFVAALLSSLFWCLRFPTWSVVLALTLWMAALAFALWLSIPPRSTQPYALRAHRWLSRACFVGSLLFLGLGIIAAAAWDSFPALLLKGMDSYVSSTICQPSVAWPVSGILALVAILFWSHAYVRFKYMEGVPPAGASSSGR